MGADGMVITRKIFSINGAQMQWSLAARLTLRSKSSPTWPFWTRDSLPPLRLHGRDTIAYVVLTPLVHHPRPNYGTKFSCSTSEEHGP